MKHILHDWSDEASKKILSNVRKAISSNGVVLLLETVVPERAVYTPDNPQGIFIPLVREALDAGNRRLNTVFNTFRWILT